MERHKQSDLHLDKRWRKASANQLWQPSSAHWKWTAKVYVRVFCPYLRLSNKHRENRLFRAMLEVRWINKCNWIMYFTQASFPTWTSDQIRKNQFATTSRMDSLTHAAVITALITHTVTIHGEQHRKQNQRRTTAHRLPTLKYTVGRCNDNCHAKLKATDVFGLFCLFCKGWMDEPCWKRRDRVKEHLTNWKKCLAEHRWSAGETLSLRLHVCVQNKSARPSEAAEKPRVLRGRHRFWLTVTWIVSPSVPRLKITWSEMYTCLVYVFGAINSHTSSGLAIRLLFLHIKQQARTD